MILKKEKEDEIKMDSALKTAILGMVFFIMPKIFSLFTGGIILGCITVLFYALGAGAILGAVVILLKRKK